MRPPVSRTLARVALAAALAAVLGSCGDKIIDLRDPQPTDPVPNPVSPARAVQRLVWSWNHRDPAPSEDLYAGDFRFEFGAPDSAAQQPAGVWFRETELASIQNLFVRGTATLPPASHITFVVDDPLVDTPSPEPGQDPRWHRMITTQVSLGVRLGASQLAAMGYTRFLLVRGDSARIPQVLRDRGYGPDSTRWWIDRWEDAPPPGGRAGLAARTDAAGPFQAMPSRLFTIAEIKQLYLSPPANGARERASDAARSR
jgi:hypothetical protein